MTVVDVSGPPKFAGTLVRSIPTQFNFSGKKLFIFVHSVHSGNLGRHFGLQNVRSSSYCPYRSYSFNKSRRNTKFNLKTIVPKLSQFCPRGSNLVPKIRIHQLSQYVICEVQPFFIATFVVSGPQLNGTIKLEYRPSAERKHSFVS